MTLRKRLREDSNSTVSQEPAPARRPRRELIDLGLRFRRLCGSRLAPVLVRVLPRGRFSLVKEHIVHVVILLIVGGVVLTNYVTEAADRESMLFRLFGEAEIVEGPMNTKTLRDQAAASGGNLAFVHAALAGGISEEDIEFELANTLGGNALVASNDPETAKTSEEKRAREIAYRVQEGDTPSAVAARFGVSTYTVLQTNGISDGEIIRPGDILVIPPGTGLYYTVRDGDTVAGIAQQLNAKVEDIIAENTLRDSAAIRIGEKLFVPGGYRQPAPRRVVAEEPAGSAPEEESGTPRPPTAESPAGSGFLWPTVGRHISQYFRWGHTGIDIPNRDLPPVYAAKNGTVAFSGWLGGYGRLVIVDHGGGLRTYYAHLSKSFVAPGEKVAKGDVVGKVGSTGRSTGPHLHFEIRQNGRALNPLNKL